MRSLMLKNIPDALYRSLKERAKSHRRSINGETIACLERVLGTTQFDPDSFLATIDKIHQEAPPQRLTDRLLRQAKEAGRP